MTKEKEKEKTEILGIERRFCSGAELRLLEDDQPKLIGYAAVFNRLSEDLGWFKEKISPGAFKESIPKDDIRALFNHDPNFVLGRSRSGTLGLSEDETGLRASITLPETRWAEDLYKSVQRGDISQMSFGFETLFDQWDKTVEPNIRTLLGVRLFDVSVVTFPAYTDTAVAARSLERFLGKNPKAKSLGNNKPNGFKDFFDLNLRIAKARSK